MHRGHVRVYRKILDNEIMLNEGMCQLFLFILLSVQYKACTVFGVDLNPGEMLTSRKSIADKLQQHENTIYRRLKWLEKKTIISIKTNNKFTVVTLLNWETYNSLENLEEQLKVNECDSECDSECGSMCDSECGTFKEVIIKNKFMSDNINKNTGVIDNTCKQPLSSSPLGDIINNTLHDSYSGELPKTDQQEPAKTAEKKKSTPKPAAEKEQTWRTNFNIYHAMVKEAYTLIINDSAEMAKQQEFNPSVDIDLTLQKAMHNFWAKPAGWDWKKKQKKSGDIDMFTTLINAIAKPANKVYKNNNQNKGSSNGQYTRRGQSDDRANEYANVR
jgi:hypothetical protein